MKKIIAVCLAAGALLISCGCHSEVAPPVPALASDGSCIVKYKDIQYDCIIRFLSKDVETLTLNSPDTVKGMTFRSGENVFTVSYSSLICRSDGVILPENSFPRITAKVIRSFRKNPEQLNASAQENGYLFSGKSYSLKTDENGIIKEILIQQ